MVGGVFAGDGDAHEGGGLGGQAGNLLAVNCKLIVEALSDRAEAEDYQIGLRGADGIDGALQFFAAVGFQDHDAELRRGVVQAVEVSDFGSGQRFRHGAGNFGQSNGANVADLAGRQVPLQDECGAFSHDVFRL